MYMCIYVAFGDRALRCAANLRTKILDFRGLDSSIILILRGGIPRPMGDFLESWSQAILAGIILVGRLSVSRLSPKQKECVRKSPPLTRREPNVP